MSSRSDAAFCRPPCDCASLPHSARSLPNAGELVEGAPELLLDERDELGGEGEPRVLDEAVPAHDLERESVRATTGNALLRFVERILDRRAALGRVERAAALVALGKDPG